MIVPSLQIRNPGTIRWSGMSAAYRNWLNNINVLLICVKLTPANKWGNIWASRLIKRKSMIIPANLTTSNQKKVVSVCFIIKCPSLQCWNYEEKLIILSIISGWSSISLGTFHHTKLKQLNPFSFFLKYLHGCQNPKWSFDFLLAFPMKDSWISLACNFFPAMWTWLFVKLHNLYRLVWPKSYLFTLIATPKQNYCLSEFLKISFELNITLFLKRLSRLHIMLY